MSEQFEIGEIAILILPPEYLSSVDPAALPYLNTEVEITRGAKPAAWTKCGVAYRFRTPDGKTGWAEPPCLKKRQPPPDWVKLCHLDNLPVEALA